MSDMREKTYTFPVNATIKIGKNSKLLFLWKSVPLGGVCVITSADFKDQNKCLLFFPILLQNRNYFAKISQVFLIS